MICIVHITRPRQKRCSKYDENGSKENRENDDKMGRRSAFAPRTLGRTGTADETDVVCDL